MFVNTSALLVNFPNSFPSVTFHDLAISDMCKCLPAVAGKQNKTAVTFVGCDLNKTVNRFDEQNTLNAWKEVNYWSRSNLQGASNSMPGSSSDWSPTRERDEDDTLATSLVPPGNSHRHTDIQIHRYGQQQQQDRFTSLSDSGPKNWISTASQQELIRRWDSERELLRSAPRKVPEFAEITQNNGHYDVRGHSRSPIFIPIESLYTISY